jgi:hypothetical protein
MASVVSVSCHGTPERTRCPSYMTPLLPWGMRGEGEGEGEEEGREGFAKMEPPASGRRVALNANILWGGQVRKLKGRPGHGGAAVRHARAKARTGRGRLASLAFCGWRRCLLDCLGESTAL